MAAIQVDWRAVQPVSRRCSDNVHDGNYLFQRRHLHNMMASSTSTPKRRRKEDGNGYRIRFSPDKTRHSTASLLDDATNLGGSDDDQSQLAGISILQPVDFLSRSSQHDVASLDDLQYSDSDNEDNATPMDYLVRDLHEELRWESLQEVGVDDAYSTCTDERMVLEGPMKSPQQTNRISSMSPSPTNLLQQQPRTPNMYPQVKKSWVGVELTIEPRARRQKRLTQSPCTTTFQVVSKGNDFVTLEGLVCETSCSSEDSHCSGEHDSLQDDNSSTHSRLVTDISTESSDSAVVEVVSDLPYTGQYQSFQRSTDSVGNSKTSFSCPHEDNIASFAHWMWSDHSRQELSAEGNNHHYPRSSRSNNNNKKKKKKRQKSRHHHSTCSTSNRPLDNRSTTGSFLFPLQHVTNSFQCTDKEESYRERSHHSKLAETSLLMQLGEELKEIAMIAGKSSECLVTTLFHQLCKE